MNLISKKQISLVKTILTRLKADSKEIAYSYSDGRTEHISQLNKDEAAQLIKWLLNETKQPVSPAEKMRKKILSMAHELRWELPFTRKGKSNHIDMAKVDDWCIRSGYLHKPLDHYTASELPALVTQFTKVYNSFLKGV